MALELLDRLKMVPTHCEMGLIHCLHEPVSCVIGVVKTTRISLSRVQRIAHVITAVKSQHSLKNKEKVGQLLIF